MLRGRKAAEVRGTPRSLSAALTGVYRSARATDWLRIASSPLALPLILIVTFALFVPSLHTYFQADDFFQLQAAHTTPIGTFILQAFDFRDTRPVPQFGFYRPLFIITYRFCFAAFGLNPLGYHLVSVFLHLGSVVLVWLIVRRLLGSVTGANFAALVFALHPAYTEAVQWIARSLNTDPMTFFYLLTMLAFMKYMDGRRYRMLLYAGSVVSFATAVLFHTTALSLVAVLPAYVFLIAGKPSDAVQFRAWARFSPFFAIAGVIALIQHHVGLGNAYQTGTFQYSSFARYLAMALSPILPEDWRQVPIAGINPLLYLYLAASLVMIAATFLLLDRRRPPYSGVFAVVWLYALLAPNTTSLLVDPLTGIIPPQLYLPGISLGFFFVLVAKEVHGMLSPALARRAARYLPLLLVGVFAYYAALSVIHERRDTKFAHTNEVFLARLRETVPPLAPGSTLYVVDPPLNLMVFNLEVALDASVELYYGDVTVHAISAKQAVMIRAAHPAALIFDYARSSRP
jgi:hypothetical protein